MAAPDGIWHLYEKNSPPIQLTYPISIDSQMMRLKLLVNKLAVICGSVSSDITNTIPTMRRHDTMVRAMHIIRRYSNKATGRCCERANSLSKAMAMIGLRNKPKNAAYAQHDNVASSNSKDIAEQIRR